MTLPNTALNLRQQGMLRIEITAIVMLLTAFLIVLAANLLSKHQADVAQAGVTPQALPAAIIDTETLGNGDPSLLSVAWQNSETP